MVYVDGNLITAPIMSQPETLSENLDTQLYLVYFSNAGYGIIKDNPIETFFNCVESRLTPEDLENERAKIDNKYMQSDKSLETLESLISENETISLLYEIILKYYNASIKSAKEKDLNDDVETPWGLLGLLIGRLEDATWDLPFKISKVPKKLRKYLDKNSFYYNVRKNPDDIITDKKAIEKMKNDVISDMECIADEINNLIINYGVDPSFTDTVINRVTKIWGQLPYLKLRNKSDHKIILDLGELITFDFDVKTQNVGGNLEHYYLHEKGYYASLNAPKLQQIITATYGVSLKPSDVKTALDSISKNDILEKDKINFKNGVYDVTRNVFINKDYNDPLNEANLENHFILNNVGVKQKDNTINLLSYDEDLTYGEINKIVDLENDDLSGMTLVEKTLREILIPKDNPEDMILYTDFLQRVGSCIELTNIYKVAPLYYGLGNDGKSILNHIISLVFNKGYKPITSATLKDNFKAKDFLNKTVITVDEITEKDLNDSGFQNEFKKMTSNTGSSSERGMHTSEMIHVESYPPLFIFANNLPTIDISEISLLQRYDVHIMPNQFVNPEELNKRPNTYLKNPILPSLLRDDIEGLSWFITASIICYKAMKEDNLNFSAHQTPSETYRIITGNDIVTEFLSLYCEIDDTVSYDEYVSNKDILEQLRTYAEIQGEQLKENTLAKDIGSGLKKIYGAKLDKHGNPATYNIKLKGFDELERESKEVYLINEDLGDNELKKLDIIGSDNRLIYNNIKQGNNTINILTNKYSKINVRKAIKELLNLNLIKRSGQKGLTEK